MLGRAVATMARRRRGLDPLTGRPPCGCGSDPTYASVTMEGVGVRGCRTWDKARPLAGGAWLARLGAGLACCMPWLWRHACSGGRLLRRAVVSILLLWH